MKQISDAELQAIERAFGPEPRPAQTALGFGGERFHLTPRQRAAYRRQRAAAEARAAK